VTVGHVHERVHLTGLAGEVDRHDRLGSWGEARFDLLDVHVQCPGLDIGENRRCSHVDHDIGGGWKRDRRGDDFVAGADIECDEA